MVTTASLEYPVYLEHLRAESQRFREVLAGCDPAARVPACPDWDAADLLWHLAEVQAFWARTIRLRPAGPDEDAVAPVRPASYAELLECFDDFSGALLTELERADPAEPAWHWAPEQTVGISYRRQAHEALIHRLDAEQTAGQTAGQTASGMTPLDPELAADGVVELLDVMYGGEAPPWGRIKLGPHHVRLDLLDVGREIWCRPGLFLGTHPESGKTYDGPHVLLTEDPGTPPAATITGSAADLDSWLWKRRDDTGIVVTGDETAYAAFRAAVTPALD